MNEHRTRRGSFTEFHALRSSTVVPYLILLLVVPGAALAEPEDRAGWHGETMPEGLNRGEIEGEYVWQKDGSVMVWIPPGEFVRGSTEGDPDELPVRRIHLDGFYIDKYEVSWAQWKKSGLEYSEYEGSRMPYPAPPDWGILDDHPVLNVSWNWAQKYLEWAGKRLPTEAEWEKAARGTDGRAFPWGNSPPEHSQAIWKNHPMATMSTAPVTWGEEGASPYGIYNMAGNVYEWCQDLYDAAFYATSPDRNPVNAGQGKPGDQRVLRGGAFVLEIDDLRSALRYRLLPIDRAPYIGFRAALSGMVEKRQE